MNGLSVINADGLKTRDTQEAMKPLQSSLERIHELIIAYQRHEAREVLCRETSKQVQEMKELRDQMQRCVDHPVILFTLHRHDILL